MTTQTEISSQRRKLAYDLRQQGQTFVEIGKRLGCGVQRARQLYVIEKRWKNREPHWSDGLSVRAANCLNNVGVNSREDAFQAYRNGNLNPLKQPRCYGWITHKEVAAWLGQAEPMKPAPRIHLAKTCPHCGEKL